MCHPSRYDQRLLNYKRAPRLALRSFLFDKIKIDRSFVTLRSGRSASAITRAITTPAEALGMQPLAEGVELQEHADKRQLFINPRREAANPLPAQFRPIYRNQYGDRRSGRFQATVTNFGTTTTGWEADIRMSFGLQLVQGRERTVRFWLLDFRNPKDGKKPYFVGAKPFIIPLSCFVFRSSPA
ncbi:MAG: hypothetical protein B7Y62_11330 [Sphingomonadales bacterium 35-56-22]|nr:MAG: hypothetical protein B7Y62_11330 [Sphingomonadales bacterium 35-56-22]OYY96498.1 MAG: hypothetical protein B7Y38_10940 [Sphingomonadales bacterium 28-56-43]